MGKKSERPRVIWLNIDALCPDIFFGLLDSGGAPNFSRIFSGGKRGVATGVFPTVTMSSQASLSTGAFPAHHLITGNAWYDRYGKTPTFRDYSTRDNALHVYGYGMWGYPTIFLPNKRGFALGNRDISGATPTLYGAVKSRSVRSAVFFNMFSRGCGEWIRPGRMDIINMKLGRDGKVPAHRVDYSAARKVSAFIKDIRQLHRLLHIYLPGLDSHSHLHGPAGQEEYIARHLDECIGIIIEGLEKVKPIENYIFVLSSDHGHAAVSKEPDRVITFKKTIELLNEIGRNGYVPTFGESPKKSSAIPLIHGGSLLLYIRNQEMRKWYEPPRLTKDLLETAKSLYELNRREACGISPGWLDLIIIDSKEDHMHYVVKDNKVTSMKKFFDNPENQDKYPDGYRRMKGLFGKRSADIILLANYEKGFHFGLPGQTGQHGNLCAADSLTPVMFAGPDISQGNLPSDSSIVDIAPTIAALYNVPMHGQDSRILPIRG